MNRTGSPFPVDDDTIEATAASWLAQREEGFTPEQEAGLLRWRLADPRHAAALDRLEETCAILGQLPLLADDPRLEGAATAVRASEVERDLRARSEPVRRPGSTFKTLRYAAGLAAVLAAGFVAWQAGLFSGGGNFRQDIATTADGYQRVLLPDSSVAQLNSSTQMRVEFSARERHITLAEGEAHFHVAKDAARPFVVTGHGVSVRAVGTAFNVRLTEAGVDVFVTEGVVRVERDGDTVPLVLAANERSLVPAPARPVAAPPVPLVEKIEPEAIRTALAWQEPRFVFVEASLAEVVRKFNARNRVQLELIDAALGVRVVGGTFRHDDVETFVRMLENSGDITAERAGADRIVLRRAP